ncbi:MAG: SRPBCC domain-containing protein [Pedococcus sp.]
MTDTKDVQIERTFDAPIDLIWAMWTEAEHFANWYGPMGAKISRADMHVHVGGRRHIAMEMQTPGGPMQMFFVGEYRQVDPKTRLVYTESMADADGNAMTAEQMGMPAGAPMETSIVVELADLGERTKMVMTHIGVPADSPGAQGWGMAINTLEARIALVRHPDGTTPH